MTNKYEYQFPEKDVFRGMETTEPDFDIFEPGRESLYVPLTNLRSKDQFKRIEKDLGIVNGRLVYKPNDFVKVIFSGHRGSGKTVELFRFHNQINNPERYFSIFVSLQEEVDLNLMAPEDFYFILITKLLRTLRETNVPYDEDEFEQIAHEWVQDEEVSAEIARNREIETGVEVKAGWKFWHIFSSEGYLKGRYGYKNATTTKIRESIKRNPADLVRRLNIALSQLQRIIESKGKGKDLIFIIDDFEKLPTEVYNAIFLSNPQLIKSLNVHLICCVPIQIFYKVQDQAASAESLKFFYLPMVQLNSSNQQDFIQILTKRVDQSLFSTESLVQIIQMSGGSPRQMLRIANECLRSVDDDEVVHEDIVKSAITTLAVERLRPLTGEHRQLLQNRDFEDISPALLELLFALNVFEYNGNNIIRKINPILEPYFKPQ
jgi:hypothetical protein